MMHLYAVTKDGATDLIVAHGRNHAIPPEVKAEAWRRVDLEAVCAEMGYTVSLVAEDAFAFLGTRQG